MAVANLRHVLLRIGRLNHALETLIHAGGGRTAMLASADIDKGRAMVTQENLLARYSILHELGRGAIGAVYAARNRETGAVVALKRLDPALLNKSDANFADRFLKHARSARLLKHRNIVKIRDAGEVCGTVYVAMEMLEGQNLRSILDAGPVPIARAIQIAHDIACGLAHAHLEGVVHGAIKPSNVIVLRSGVVKITDFGIGQSALLAEARGGCLSYMSPEQLRGDPIDHRCDLFSLGALFYEMLTRRPPFEGGSPKEIMQNVLHARPPRPSDLNPHVPRALDATVFSMLAGEPVGRMAGAPILLGDLQRLEEGLGLGSGTSAEADEPTVSAPPARPEPEPRTPDANGFRYGTPKQDAARFARRAEGRDASGEHIHANSSAAEDFQQNNRATDREAFDYHKAMVMMERESRRERSSASRPAMFATLALVLVVLGIGGVAGFMYYSSKDSQLGVAAARIQQPQPSATAPGASQASLSRAVGDGQAEQESSGALSARNPMPPKPLAAEPGPLAQTESLATRAPEQPEERAVAASPMPEAPAPEAPAPKPPAAEPGPTAPTEIAVAPTEIAVAPPAKIPEQPPGVTARVIVSVSPRGEIYIDGKHHGTTPPITTFDLEPGMHRIEVRSGSRKPYLTYMTVQAGDVRRIRHDFDASRAAHPPRTASWQNSNRPAR